MLTDLSKILDFVSHEKSDTLKNILQRLYQGLHATLHCLTISTLQIKFHRDKANLNNSIHDIVLCVRTYLAPTKYTVMVALPKIIQHHSKLGRDRPVLPRHSILRCIFTVVRICIASLCIIACWSIRVWFNRCRGPQL